MTKINNSDIINGLQKTCGITTNEVVPNTLSTNIVATVETNPLLVRRTNIVKVGNSIATLGIYPILTTTNKDFYITGASLYYVKDVLCDVANGFYNITAYIGGANIAILSIPRLTLTADKEGVFITFPVPIKVDKNTIINASAFTYAAGTSARSWLVMGYYDEGSF